MKNTPMKTKNVILIDLEQNCVMLHDNKVINVKTKSVHYHENSTGLKIQYNVCKFDGTELHNIDMERLKESKEILLRSL